MSALPRFSVAHEPVTRDILQQLIEQTMLAHDVVADGDALEVLLAGRSAMVDALEHSVHTLAAASSSRVRPPRIGDEAELAQLAEILERENAALLQGVRAERERVALALADLNRPDPLGSKYGSAPLSSTHLNLVR